MDAISLRSTVAAAKDQVSAELADEIVILSLRSGRYYGLGEVGGRIWDLLREPRSVAQICDVLVEEYDVPREPCERDVVALLEQLASNGLIEVRDAADSPIPAPAGP